MSKKKKTCPYSECVVETMFDTHNYPFKLILFLVGIAMIVKSPETFTFVNVILLVFPALLDNYSLMSKTFGRKKLFWFNKMVNGINVFIIIVCIFGLTQFLVDTGDAFCVVDTSLLGANFSISKVLVAYALLINCAETVIMWIVAPKDGEAAIFDAFNNTKKGKESA